MVRGQEERKSENLRSRRKQSALTEQLKDAEIIKASDARKLSKK